jgi:hemerythrin-like metal-binding protein
VAFLPWKDEYSVRVELFDSQHKKMFEYINDLGDAINKVEEHAVLRAILSGLISYTKIHFKDEEVNMKRYKYPGYDHHKKEHEVLTNRVNTFALEFYRNKDMTVNVMDFLHDWILIHILNTDMKYSAFLSDKKVVSCL